MLFTFIDYDMLTLQSMQNMLYVILCLNFGKLR